MAKQIVVVDDDTDILEFIQLALTFEGYHVRVSRYGQASYPISFCLTSS